MFLVAAEQLSGTSPGSGALDGADIIVFFAALRRWEETGVGDGAYSQACSVQK